MNETEITVHAEMVQSLAQQVSELKAYLRDRLIATRSEQLDQLFTALAQAQAAMQVAGLSAENPYFKSRYADFATVVKASRPHLTKQGLSVIQQITTAADGSHMLHTLLAHASGQWIESRMRIVPLKNDIQSFGSMLTYLRRYSYASLVGVVASDEDDDGERAVSTARERERGPKSIPF